MSEQLRDGYLDEQRAGHWRPAVTRQERST